METTAEQQRLTTGTPDDVPIMVTGAYCPECGSESDGVISVRGGRLRPFPFRVSASWVRTQSGRRGGHRDETGWYPCTGQLLIAVEPVT